MSKPHRYIKHPEFTNLDKFVWEYLNTIGRSIPQVQKNTSRDKIVKGDPACIKLKNKPVWHNKEELDEFVARSLNIKLNDYYPIVNGKRDTNKGKNALYKAVANEVGKLRRDKILIDWKRSKIRNTGMGIWKLNKVKLEEYATKKGRREIKQKDYHSAGSEMTVYVRGKQDAFKRALLQEYGKCALCKFKIHEYMIGAHIVPHNVMLEQEPENAMNPTNGLLLCRFCDVAFEGGSITIDKNLGIDISDQLQDRNEEVVKAWLEPIPTELYIRKDAKYPPASKYLKWKKDLVTK